MRQDPDRPDHPWLLPPNPSMQALPIAPPPPQRLAIVSQLTQRPPSSPSRSAPAPTAPSRCRHSSSQPRRAGPEPRAHRGSWSGPGRRSNCSGYRCGTIAGSVAASALLLLPPLPPLLLPPRLRRLRSPRLLLHLLPLRLQHRHAPPVSKYSQGSGRLAQEGRVQSVAYRRQGHPPPCATCSPAARHPMHSKHARPTVSGGRGFSRICLPKACL